MTNVVARRPWLVVFVGLGLPLAPLACGGGGSASVGPQDSGGGDGTMSGDTSASGDTSTPGDTSTGDMGIPNGDTGAGDGGLPETGGLDTGSPDAAGSVCGNDVLEPGEQCDDGNLVDLDGCDSTCHFEQETRATDIAVQFTTDAFCAHNAIGGAVQSPAQGDFQTIITDDVKTGEITVLFKYFAITDLTGQTGTASVGSYAAAPMAYTGTATGSSDLDWWYTLATTSAGPSPLYTPTATQLTGTFAAGTLTAGGASQSPSGHILLPIFGGAALDMSAASLRLPVGAATTPTASSGAPPGHLASEHLLGTLKSFPTAGGVNSAPTGQLCGNITAASMATPGSVPSSLAAGGSDACTEGYTAANSALDLWVGGCHVNDIITVEVIAPTQPDTDNPDAPAQGAGAPYALSATGGGKIINTCKDKNGATQTLATCLEAAAYSAYLKLAMDRVILKHP
jgi:cysteine-rich repeat protein